MHIGIDIRSLLAPQRTGVGEYIYELLNTLFIQDTTNYYYLFYNIHNKKNNNFLPEWKLPQVHFIHHGWPNKIFNSSIFTFHHPQIDKLIKQKLDFFYSPHLNFTALSPSIPRLLTIHDLAFELFPHFFSLKQRIWHQAVQPRKQCVAARFITTPSENTKRDLINYYHIDPAKIEVIYPGISSLFTNKLLELNQEKIKKTYQLTDPFILFLGTFEPRKNILSLIQAFELCYSQLPEPHLLVIAGSEGWKNKELYHYISQSPLKEKIKFINYVPSEDKPALYKAASIFVYPSFYEGFGFPVLEAMVSGTPIITSQFSSLPEITSKTAYLINPHQPHSIAKGIYRILSDKKIKQSLIEAAGIQAQKFNWIKTAIKFLDLTKKMI
jgi:glycosyltransferase involved in cell wall biosynthesis